jgi:threonine synthase
VLEPHGAVAWAALEKFNPNELAVSLETAHPAKFPEIIKEMIGIDPELPDCMKKNEGKEEKYTEMENKYEVFKKFLGKL